MEKPNLKKALEELVEVYKAKLKAQAKIDKTYATGKFANSFESKTTDDGFEITSNVDYAGAVNSGSSPATKTSGGIEKVESLKVWARAKNIRPIAKLKGGYKFRRLNTDKRSAFNSMIFAISKSIAEKGTIKRYQYNGSNIFNKVYKSMERKIGSDLSEAFAIDLKNDMAKIINKIN